MDQWRQTERTEHVQTQHRMPLMTSDNQSTEEPSTGSSRNDSENSCAECYAQKKRSRSFLRAGLSFSAGGLFVAAALVASGLANTVPLFNMNDARLPQIASGKDELTGQPASWFNGNCGSSAEEAKSRNCVFDLVSHSWLPHDCLSTEDLEDADIMYANSTWHWGLDDMKEVSLEDVRRGEFDRVWTSMDWHVAHCGFVWKRLHRALLDPWRKLDSYTADYHHTGHCVDMIARLNPVGPINATGTRVYTKFPTCS